MANRYAQDVLLGQTIEKCGQTHELLDVNLVRTIASVELSNFGGGDTAGDLGRIEGVAHRIGDAVVDALEAGRVWISDTSAMSCTCKIQV